jgi:hypothetical protein
MRRLLLTPLFAAISMAFVALSVSPADAATGKRVSITGEVIDSWCYITEIMFPEGTAHHQCALWCAAGGIPVGILADDGQVYMVLKVGSDTKNVANPTFMKIQTHRVSVNGDLYERDGIKYLLVSAVTQDEGIVKKTHEEYGIQPFGN